MAAPMAPSTASGIATDELSDEVRPQDDLFRHVNSRWLATTEIPPDRAAHGAFHMLHDQSELDVRALAEEAAASDAPAGSDERKVGDLWAAFMDVDAVEAADAAPLADDLAAIRAVSSPARAGGPARPPPAPRDVGSRRVVRRQRRRRRHPLRRQPGPGRARAARRGLLPRGRLRRHPRRLRRARRHHAAPRRRGRRRRRRGPDHGPRDGSGPGPLDHRRQPRRPQDPQQAHPRRPDRPRPRVRLGRVARRARRPRRRLRRGRRPPAVRHRDRGAPPRRAAPRRLEGVADLPPRPLDRPVPVQPVRRRQLRLLRHAAVGHPRAARAVEAGGGRRRGRVGRGRRPALRGPPLPARAQGPHGPPGRLAGRGLPGRHQHASSGCRPRRASGRSRSSTSSRPRSATPTAGATTPPSTSTATTCWAASGGPRRSRSTGTWPRSAVPSTATSGT